MHALISSPYDDGDGPLGPDVQTTATPRATRPRTAPIPVPVMNRALRQGGERRRTRRTCTRLSASNVCRRARFQQTRHPATWHTSCASKLDPRVARAHPSRPTLAPARRRASPCQAHLPRAAGRRCGHDHPGHQRHDRDGQQRCRLRGVQGNIHLPQQYLHDTQDMGIPVWR